MGGLFSSESVQNINTVKCLQKASFSDEEINKIFKERRSKEIANLDAKIKLETNTIREKELEEKKKELEEKKNRSINNIINSAEKKKIY